MENRPPTHGGCPLESVGVAGAEGENERKHSCDHCRADNFRDILSTVRHGEFKLVAAFITTRLFPY